MLPLHRGGEWVSTQQTWSSSPLSRTRMLLTTALCCTQECGLTMLDQPTIQEMAGLVRWDTARTEHACGNGTGDGLSSSKVLQRLVSLRFTLFCSLRMVLLRHPYEIYIVFLSHISSQFFLFMITIFAATSRTSISNGGQAQE